MCGALGGACCAGAICQGAAVCVGAVNGVGGMCSACGAAGEACCGGGAIANRTCNAGLACTASDAGAGAATCR
jgi:hypothetical protein